MNYQQEYKEELQKVQDKDFTHSWVSSSAFLFYLQVACIVAFVLGGCYMLYNKRFEKPEVKVQESTLYTPKYK
jgi:hypothetical protein